MVRILLDYIIKKSYADKEAQEVLNQWDAARTGKSIEQVRCINNLIRNGDTKLAREIVKEDSCERQ